MRLKNPVLNINIRMQLIVFHLQIFIFIFAQAAVPPNPLIQNLIQTLSSNSKISSALKSFSKRDRHESKYAQTREVQNDHTTEGYTAKEALAKQNSL